jgi:hypothetical protein
LPSPDAARELWALGFGTIIFHVQDVEKFRKEADRIIGGLANLARPHLVPIREGGSLRVFRLIAEGPVTTDVGSLAPANRRRLRRSVGDVGVPFGLVSGKATFRHPDPIQPTDFLVTWTQGERVVQSQVVRGLLPLALAAGRKADIALEASVPEIVGEFDVTLALADDPKLILAREHIIVGDGDER